MINKKVNYGGEIVFYGFMVSDLQTKAKSIYPEDERKQQRLVDRYLQGHSMIVDVEENKR